MYYAITLKDGKPDQLVSEIRSDGIWPKLWESIDEAAKDLHTVAFNEETAVQIHKLSESVRTEMCDPLFKWGGLSCRIGINEFQLKNQWQVDQVKDFLKLGDRWSSVEDLGEFRVRIKVSGNADPI